LFPTTIGTEKARMQNLGLWQIFVSLGVPGLALGIMYMLFPEISLEFPKVPAGWVGPIIVLFLCLAGGITFYALKLFGPPHDRGHEEQAKSEVPARSRQDVTNQNALVGTWRSTGRMDLPSGVSISSLRYTFSSGQTYTLTGSYRFLGISYPINVSGTWDVRDGFCRGEVKSSNVPIMVKEGFSWANKIVRVTDDEYVFINSLNNEQVRDPRIR